MKISFYKLVGLFILTALAPWLMPTAIAQVTIAGWDMNAQTNFGTSPLTATTAAANVTIGQLTKGSGIITSGTAATRAWGGGTTSTWGTASATSISNSAFATFTVTPAAGYSLSLSAFNMDYRISGTGPTSLLLQYRINTGAYVDIATYTGLSTNAAGAALPTTSLTGIAALQNLTSASTVTFRIVPYGAVGGTWYIYDRLNTTANDLVLTGTITQILTPTTTSITPSSATAGSGGFTLTVNGTNFTSGSIVQWNGVALTTTFVNA
ncbi:MAG TPA: IPT/TIG domain-containing protein, partial [Chitinophagales bacterium]|nr:IPT/TIG domain-containing protein [Chitinophagales bacterium]